MNDWQDIWDRLREGRHVVSRRAGRIPQPDPTELRLAWVDCEDYPEPRGSIEQACRWIDRFLGVHPVMDAASRRLRAGLRRHLLGEGWQDVARGRYEDTFGRSPFAAGPRAALVLCRVDRADAASLELLARLVSDERTPRWPLLLDFGTGEPRGAAAVLLQHLERVLPLEAFWRQPEPSVVAPRVEVSGVEAERAPSDATLRVLRAAATIGDRFESDVLAALLHVDSSDVLDAMQEAVDRGVPIEDRGQGVFRFDPGAAATLRAQTLPSVARAWHERLALLLGAPLEPERSGARARPELLVSRPAPELPGARHEAPTVESPASPARPARLDEVPLAPASSGRSPPPRIEPEPVRPFGEGEQPEERTDREVVDEPCPPTQRDGSEHFDACGDVPPRPRDPRPEAWWERLRSQASTTRLAQPPSSPPRLNASEEPRPVLIGAEKRAATHAESAGLWDTACEQHLAAAASALLVGEHERAIEFSSRALALAPQLADAERRRLVRARALSALGRARWQTRNAEQASLEQALEPLLEAQRLLGEDAEPELRAEVAASIADVCYDIGTPDALERALDELTRASRIWLEAGQPLDAARLLNDEAAVWVKLGDPVRANHLLSRSREVFSKVAGSYAPAQLELLETEHLLARLVLHSTPSPGRERDALRFAIEHALVAEEGYRELDDQLRLGRVWETLGRLELRLGRLEEAARRLDAARQLQQHTGDAIGVARSAGGLSDVLVAARDYPRALEQLAESVECNSEKGSSAGLRANLVSLERLLALLPEELDPAARALGRRIQLAIGVP